MSIKNIHKIEQPREKLEKYGPGRLGDAELLAIVLRTGPKGTGVLELSKNIFRQFNNGKLAFASFEDLKNIHGLGPAKACEIVACFELGKRLLKNKQAELILSPQKVWEGLKDIRDNKKEHFVIISHNHPSGSLEPSNEDLAVTRRLVEAGKLLGIEVLDHVIVTKEAYVSFKEKNLI